MSIIDLEGRFTEDEAKNICDSFLMSPYIKVTYTSDDTGGCYITFEDKNLERTPKEFDKVIPVILLKKIANLKSIIHDAYSKKNK